MKKSNVLFLVILFIVTFISYINVNATEKLPEFDGGYIKTVKDDYMEIKEVEAKPAFGGYAFVTDKSSIVNIQENEFKGLLVKGNYKFESFSLHHLVEKYVNSGKGKQYLPGDKIDLQSKNIGDGGYYFQPRDKLVKGDYVAWIGKSFWLFSIK